MRNLSAFGAGLLFGLGLWLSGMADPRKVLGFLDVTGQWDPSLLLVMGGAVAVTASFTLPVVLKRKAPLLGGAFELPARSAIDAPWCSFTASVWPGPSTPPRRTTMSSPRAA